MEIKRLITIIWLIICVPPLWAVAEEPVNAPAGEGFNSERVSESSRADFAGSRFDLAHLGERRGASIEFSLPEWVEEMGTRLSDEELSLITGEAILADSPDMVPTDSRIILWDEVSGRSDQTGDLKVKTLDN